MTRRDPQRSDQTKARALRRGSRGAESDPARNCKGRIGSGINAQPITYTHKGRQYVTIQSGIGGVNVLRMAQQLANVPRGGSVWTFALMPE